MEIVLPAGNVAEDGGHRQWNRYQGQQRPQVQSRQKKAAERGPYDGPDPRHGYGRAGALVSAA